VEQEGFVIGVKAFVGAIIERLRAIGRLKLHIGIAIDGYEILIIQAERIAVRAGKAGPFEIDRSMYIHGILQSRRGGPGARLARSPATNFLAARIVTFASLIALCENQASHIALQRFSARPHTSTPKVLEARRNPDWARALKQLPGRHYGLFESAGLT
jgi:hypothetical protein